MATINTIIVLRNDTKEAWEAENSYVLKQGEVGIGYTTDGKVIAKVGNGTASWKSLPQIEGVFEDNLTLTYAFGKYSPDTSGSFILNTAGKTMSEVMLDAFAQEIYTGLIKTEPSASFSATGGGSGEAGATHGNPVAKLDLTISGTYKYNAKNSAGAIGNANITATEAHITYNNNKVATLDSSNPNADLTYTLTLSGDKLIYQDGSESYDFYGTVKTGADANRPLTNLGNFVAKDAEDNYFGTKDFSKAIGQIPAKTLVNNSKKTVTFTGYRKMFMGVVDEDPTTVNSTFIRGLSTVSEQAKKTTKEFTANAGKKSFYVAIPTSLTTSTPTFKYKFMGKWEALDGVVALPGTVDVAGASNKVAAKPYKVYKYTPETASGKFEAATEVQVTVV